MKQADIAISFEKPEHFDVDPYTMNDPVLAHAFRPGPGVAGDVHFREDKNWDFDVTFAEQPGGDRISFFSVALHELGHTLGLGHSDLAEAVMYEFYTSSTGVLSPDDISGIRHIYGVPWKATERPTIDDSDEIPNKCEMSYDAIAMIRNELFIFKGRYVWNANKNSSAMEIRSLWPELPANLTHIDAAIVNEDDKLLFFSGRNIFGYGPKKYEFTSTIQTLGIDHHFDKIDAIFKWNVNNVTYIFSGNQYWRLDKKRVNKHYPKDIMRAFRDVYDIDTAFSTSDNLYFFKDKYFYEFDARAMRINRMKPQTSAQKFMNCPKVDLPSRNDFEDDNDRDVIDKLDPVIRPDDDANIERVYLDEPTNHESNSTKKPEEGGGAVTHRLLLSIMAASLAISRLPSILLYF